MRDYLKNKLGVPENWDKYDYQTQRYSFDDIKEILQTYKDEQLCIGGVVGQSEQLVAFCRWYNQAIPSYETTEEEIVETYLRESN